MTTSTDAHLRGLRPWPPALCGWCLNATTKHRYRPARSDLEGLSASTPTTCARASLQRLLATSSRPPPGRDQRQADRRPPALRPIQQRRPAPGHRQDPDGGTPRCRPRTSAKLYPRTSSARKTVHAHAPCVGRSAMDPQRLLGRIQPRPPQGWNPGRLRRGGGLPNLDRGPGKLLGLLELGRSTDDDDEGRFNAVTPGGQRYRSMLAGAKRR
jgi:hypothetical protein